MIIAYRCGWGGRARYSGGRPIGGFNVFAHGATGGGRITFVVRAIKYWWKKRKKKGEKRERREKKEEWNLWFFGGTEWKTRRKRYPTGGETARRYGGGVAVRWRCKGTAIFQTVSATAAARAPSSHPPPMPNGHSLFFPECPRKHPVYIYVPPSDRYRKFTLCLGMKIRVVATRPFGVTFMRNWVIRWKQLSVYRIYWKGNVGTAHRSFRWYFVGQRIYNNISEQISQGKFSTGHHHNWDYRILFCIPT